MKTSLSWIKEYVDVPASVSTDEIDCCDVVALATDA